MSHYLHNDVVITEKELLKEIINLKEKINELETDRRNQRKIVNQYKCIFPKITKPMFLTDVSGKIIDANVEFQNLLGYTLFDLKRMSIKSITHSEIQEIESNKILEELKEKSHISLRSGVYFKINGEKIEVEFEAFAIYDNNNQFDGITRIIKNIL